MSRRQVLLVALVVCSLAAGAFADVYMHNPRGSNDRNCERNVNRRNGNRLFDSQNNAKGGYACPRAVGGPEITTKKMYYYAGSKLPIEWTAQHGCGTNPKEHCEIVLQYACEDTLDPEQKFRSGSFIGTPRDGIPRDSADDATDTIPADPDSAVADTVANRRYGMHESIDFYNKCRQRRRNMGLFHADQRMRRRDARATRQNPNGNRRGLECPEERDYYPYWHPTPWRDIAVLTSEPKRCPFFEAETQNVKAKGECVEDANGNSNAAQMKAQGRWYNNEADCKEAGHNWVEYRFGHESTAKLATKDLYCAAGSFGRINHLGNVEETSAPIAGDKIAIPHRNNANRFIWTIPDEVINENCVLRLRYNISTADYPAWEIDGTPIYNSTFDKKPPIKQDPYIQIGSAEDEFVSLALNTNQYGRTFQDRSYVFAIRSPPADKDPSATIYNLNVRGKRGNIVQTYPAVEYDFIPNDLNVNTNDLIHFQWTGSDYNPRRGCNDAEGGPPDPNTASEARKNSRADRNNLIEMEAMDMNMPRDITTSDAVKGKTMFVDENGDPDMGTIMKLAFLDQKQQLAATARRCLTQEELNEIQNKNQRENHPQNCAKMNAAFTPYFDAGLVKMRATGAYTYFSSRNNNFSNRDQTGRICVGVICGDASASTPRGVDNIAAVETRITNDAVLVEEENILQEETFAFDAKDNDAFGDGEEEDCENMRFSFDGISSGAAVALAFSMIAVGVVATIGGQVLIKRYQNQKASLLDDRAAMKSTTKRRKAPPVPSASKKPARRAPPPPPRRV